MQRCVDAWAQQKNNWNIWLEFVSKQKRGIEAPKVSHGIRRTRENISLGKAHEKVKVTSSTAVYAGPSSQHTVQKQLYAPKNAQTNDFDTLKSHLSNESAFNALQNLFPDTPPVVLQHAARNVKTTIGGPEENEKKAVGHQPVYNLTIANHPCYYANGLLVHNCTLALRRFRTGGFIRVETDAIDDDERYRRRKKYY
jgi:hypothetical protein